MARLDRQSRARRPGRRRGPGRDTGVRRRLFDAALTSGTGRARRLSRPAAGRNRPVGRAGFISGLRSGSGGIAGSSESKRHMGRRPQPGEAAFAQGHKTRPR